MKLRIVLFLTFLLLLSNRIYTQAQSPVLTFLKHVVKKDDTPASIAKTYRITEKDFLLLNDFPETVELKPGQEVLIRALKNGEVSGFGYSFSGEKSNASSVDIDPNIQTQSIQFLKHRVREGETAASIAADFGVEKKYFLLLNDFPSNVELVPGQEVLLRPLKNGPEISSKDKSSTKTMDNDFISSETVTNKISSSPNSASVLFSKSVQTGPNGAQYKVSDSKYHFVQPKQTFYRIALIYGLTIEELKELNNLSSTDISIGQKLKVAR